MRNKKGERKPIVMLVCYVAIILPVFLTSWLLEINGKIVQDYSGFAIDSLGNLYVGNKICIDVYDDGLLIRKIYPQANRSYAFTINKDDTICLSTGSNVYMMDLCGNMLDATYHADRVTRLQLEAQKKTFRDVKGNTYFMRTIWGRTQIVRNDTEIIYKMPLLDCIIRWISTLAWISLFVCVPIIVIKLRKVYARKNKTG
nr:hypothetical protein [Maliibacterium massiliense]